jgi:hypothetical protein
MPSYYSQVAASFSGSKYDIYAVNTKNGKVEAVKRVNAGSYDERTIQQTSLACMSEQTGFLYTVEEGIISSYGIGLEDRNGEVYIELRHEKKGNPVYHRNPAPASDATGVAKYDKCTIVGDDLMGYIGDSSREVGNKQRFYLVNSMDGKLVNDKPNNDLTATGHLNYAPASAFRNGTVLITGHDFYTIIDANGNGRNFPLVGDGRSYSFAISNGAEQKTMAYDGRFLFKENGFKVAVERDMTRNVILHEKFGAVVQFKRVKKAIGGKIYDVDTGELNRNVPSFWEGDADDRVFWEDALFTIAFEDNQLVGQGFSGRFIKLTAIPVKKSQFKRNDFAGLDQGFKRSVEN